MFYQHNGVLAFTATDWIAIALPAIAYLIYFRDRGESEKGLEKHDVIWQDILNREGGRDKYLMPNKFTTETVPHFYALRWRFWVFLFKPAKQENGLSLLVADGRVSLGKDKARVIRYIHDAGKEHLEQDIIKKAYDTSFKYKPVGSKKEDMLELLERTGLEGKEAAEAIRETAKEPTRAKA